MRPTIIRNAIFYLTASILLVGCGGESGDDIFAQGEQACLDGDYEKGIELFTKAATLMPNNPSIYANRANCHSYLGDLDAAIKDYATAIDKAIAIIGNANDPRMAIFYYNRGYAYEKANHFKEAIADYEMTIELDEDYPDVTNNLAWILATCPEASIRDPKRAVELARRQAEARDMKEPGDIDTLAAALAATGEYEQAVTMQEKAIELLTDEGEIKEFTSRLDLYKAGKPYFQDQ